MRQIQQHASPNVNKILVANKCDVDPSERVCHIVHSFHHDDLINLHVDEAFRSIAVDVQKRLAESDSDRLDVANQTRIKLDEQATRSSDGCC
ncbi:hypothetical protein DYB25_014182 [Aphanomyces astaci]|uniref:Uncharacterized protein n=1 Tax=Aphanomyces astaci TaxID=112090 RepID=A0A397EEH5_APHAT|nr:hypothetical protein DYB25_014182 [Aphanomyces astaci]RHY55171.1 hypothetical protein DYB34_005609 [Aphanomyces astaci]RHY64364.1 hypothetical protein DYB30_005762 [Aphanomyces astaci]RHY77865.1 hypothetical protein DYB38_003778 [Aphanomyces astaci]